ncbi:MAG TPA: winged helix-turn-helix domain-containing protein [Phycisphaerae bacterium]|nr:winged helix-turn-helix domain-containing protein [Phycisphaerae bacterium]
MEKQIGETAGVVWRHLSTKGEVRTADLQRATSTPKAAMDRAIGWLAREDKVITSGDGLKETIRLKK